MRQDKPDAPDLVRGWQQAEPARKLPNLAGMPILILMAEASYHAAYDHCTATYLTQAGVPNTFMRLGDVGIRGNGHMMMLEKNSDIAAVAAVASNGWLKAKRRTDAWPLREAGRRVTRLNGDQGRRALPLPRPSSAQISWQRFFFAALFLPLPHNSLLASRAPSTSACSFAH